MRARPSSRLLVVDDQSRLLLFRFEHRLGPLAGRPFWATPGGGLDPGETFQGAARRELLEETGIQVEETGPEVARRQFQLTMPDGELVQADERFFLVRVAAPALDRARWTALEVEVMTEHRWWTVEALRSTDEQVWPENLGDILEAALAEGRQAAARRPLVRAS